MSDTSDKFDRVLLSHFGDEHQVDPHITAQDRNSLKVFATLFDAGLPIPDELVEAAFDVYHAWQAEYPDAIVFQAMIRARSLLPAIEGSTKVILNGESLFAQVGINAVRVEGYCSIGFGAGVALTEHLREHYGSEGIVVKRMRSGWTYSPVEPDEHAWRQGIRVRATRIDDVTIETPKQKRLR